VSDRNLGWVNSKSDWDQFIGLLSPTPGERILDVGAGRGTVAGRIINERIMTSIYAVDPDEERVARMRRDFPKVNASVAAAERLPFPDAHFDKVYTTMALHHYADLDVALSEIGRVLKQGGAFVVLEVDPRSAKGMLFRFFGRLTGEHMNMMTEEELNARLGPSALFKKVRSIRQGSGYLVQLTRA